MAVWREAAGNEPPAETEQPWTFATNPALTSLLDHLAEELALEYARLMKLAADSGGPPNDSEVH
jgi:hypothetical protein